MDDLVKISVSINYGEVISRILLSEQTMQLITTEWVESYHSHPRRQHHRHRQHRPCRHDHTAMPLLMRPLCFNLSELSQIITDFDKSVRIGFKF